ncbi:MAG: molybdopterin molybdotransferase MoeA [Burkholderiales bacterium]|jgi:molybdopterin molybdotransferase|nr:molybdopterin molybdotransferase MoeA [Burkholderiales bacterium]
MSNELSVAEALASLAPRVPVVARTESLAIADALSRVLALPVVARLDLPAFDNAAMDGYALRAADATGPATRLRLVGRALAGHAWGGTIGTGECVRITTGAPMPLGADAVVMQEHARVEGETIEVDGPVAASLNCRQRGEHVRTGETILAAGRRLATYDLGLIAAAGWARVQVHSRPRVGVLSTGDELADPPAPLASGGAYDGNRSMLLAEVARAGFAPVDLGICPDRAGAFDAVLERALALGLDALITTGGAAQGDADVVRQAGSVEFVALNIRPGRGVVFGLLGVGTSRMVLLGLPGNAVAAYVMYRLLARPLLDRMAGGEARMPQAVPVPLAGALRRKGGRIDYRRARYATRIDGSLAVEPLAQQGSAMLRSLADADVLIAVGPQSDYAAGDLIPSLPLDRAQ